MRTEFGEAAETAPPSLVHASNLQQAPPERRSALGLLGFDYVTQGVGQNILAIGIAIGRASALKRAALVPIKNDLGGGGGNRTLPNLREPSDPGGCEHHPSGSVGSYPVPLGPAVDAVNREFERQPLAIRAPSIDRAIAVQESHRSDWASGGPSMGQHITDFSPAGSRRTKSLRMTANAMPLPVTSRAVAMSSAVRNPSANDAGLL